ncbi:uroporphyrinogen-III synthase [Sphingomicrobium nitratireducens]|uniref:uroporphyrinogen-III synthase n=1 Tax=Sphingomicrobium nitratireducens TaxID=2964666 RepID=UPI00223F9DD5|nr:uroporphyrinogen-III synthase [Sphingomicrobium nitratireducens]
MKPLVILRPEPGASLSLARAEKMGFDEIARIPLFKVQPVDWSPPDPDRFDALLLTSANAPRHAGEGMEAYKRLPAHAVGDATAAAARTAGLMVDRIGDEGVDALLSELPGDLRLLHLCGQHRRQPREARQTIVPVPVYASVARDRPEHLDRLPGSVACVHSARAGQHLAALVDRAGFDRSTIAIAAISEEAARGCGEGWAEVASSRSPEDASLLALAKRLCEDRAARA